ncbi:MAG: class I tRNA ligase family protein [Alphaproteobacteria bacterium]
MYGKDHLASAELYSAICKIAGGNPPNQFMYELFLDDKGQKISKSKGNGLTIDEWLRYAPQESLAYYMYQSPRKAKRLYFDVIPKAVDEYQSFIEKFPAADDKGKAASPAWHIHGGKPPQAQGIPSFNLLLNLAGCVGTDDPAVLWGFVSQYMDGATPATHPFLDSLVKGAVNYYQDFVKPHKKYRLPNETEQKALIDLAAYLDSMPASASAEDIQNEIYAIGRKYEFEPMKAWFSALYETLLGQEQGPRMGSFTLLYGPKETSKLIRRVLANEDLAA